MTKISKIAIFLLLFIILIICCGYGFHVYSSTFSIAPSLPKSTGIKPSESLSIHFTEPVKEGIYTKNIHISPSVSGKTTWNAEKTILTLTPKTHWEPELQYSIKLPEGKTTKFAIIEATSISFQTISHPQVLSVTPQDNAIDVLLDIEDPLVVKFDSSTKNFFIDFSIEPHIDVTYENNPEKTEFRVLPKEDIQNGEKYTLVVSSRYKDGPDDSYKKIATSSFTMRSPAPENWSENLDERITQAKLYTKAKKLHGKYIDVNLTSQVMSMFENGKLLNSFIISSGKKGMDTPQGEFTIHNKHPRAWSRSYGLYMPFWMAITPDGKYGLHELPEWPGGYKEGQDHLGIPVSHGCVRLGIGSAETLYNWTEVGTPVIVYQ